MMLVVCEFVHYLLKRARNSFHPPSPLPRLQEHTSGRGPLPHTHIKVGSDWGHLPPIFLTSSTWISQHLLSAAHTLGTIDLMEAALKETILGCAAWATSGLGTRR